MPYVCYLQVLSKSVYTFFFFCLKILSKNTSLKYYGKNIKFKVIFLIVGMIIYFTNVPFVNIRAHSEKGKLPTPQGC